MFREDRGGGCGCWVHYNLLPHLEMPLNNTLLLSSRRLDAFWLANQKTGASSESLMASSSYCLLKVLFDILFFYHHYYYDDEGFHVAKEQDQCSSSLSHVCSDPGPPPSSHFRHNLVRAFHQTNPRLPGSSQEGGHYIYHLCLSWSLLHLFCSASKTLPPRAERSL